MSTTNRTVVLPDARTGNRLDHRSLMQDAVGIWPPRARARARVTFQACSASMPGTNVPLEQCIWRRHHGRSENWAVKLAGATSGLRQTPFVSPPHSEGFALIQWLAGLRVASASTTNSTTLIPSRLGTAISNRRSRYRPIRLYAFARADQVSRYQSFRFQKSLSQPLKVALS